MMLTLFSHAFWPLMVLLSWGVAYLFIFRPMLSKIQAQMGTDKALKLPYLPKKDKVILWLDGSKTLIASFVLSLFSIGKAFLDNISVNTDLLDNLKTNVPWVNIVTPDIALRIVAFFTLVITLLHLYGKMTAAAATPPAT